MKRSVAFVSCLSALAALATITTSSTARADREIALGLSYDPRVPVGSLHTLVPEIAYAGIQGKWEYYAIADRLTVGFDVQYQYFQQGTKVATEPLPNGAVTAPFTRYAYFFSILPSVRWFFLGPESRFVRPFVEVGLGATSATAAVLASDLSRRSNVGGFIAQPSVGVIWAIVSREGIRPTAASASLETEPWRTRPGRESMIGIVTSAAWSFTTADVLSARNVSYVGLQLGVYAKL
jgi:hypothetical protein